jgi:predicted  nucleic acid-binding Zn-ribbon protein
LTQPLPLREQLKALEMLQELDLRIDAIKKKKGAIPAALRSMEEAFGKSRTAVEAKKKELEDNEKAQRQTKAAMELNTDRLTRANSKLEGVQNGHEFNAANKEIEQLKKMNLSLAEQLKKSVADAAQIAKDLEALQARMGEAEAQRDQQASSLSSEGGQFDRDADSLLAERAQYTGKIEKRILLQYDRVRGARAGIGIVPVLGGRCKGCNMILPPQLYNQVQRGVELQACPSCHRLMFVPPPAGADAGSSAAQR